MTKIPPAPLMTRPRRLTAVEQAAQAEAEAEAAALAEAEVGAHAELVDSPQPPAAPPGPAAATKTSKPRTVSPSAALRPPSETTPRRQVKGATTSILLQLPEDAKQRMVAALAWTSPRTGIKSQQSFMRTAISELCDRLEAEYNNGEPFPDPAE